jgi:hypothetical protein
VTPRPTPQEVVAELKAAYDSNEPIRMFNAIQDAVAVMDQLQAHVVGCRRLVEAKLEGTRLIPSYEARQRELAYESVLASMDQLAADKAVK